MSRAAGWWLLIAAVAAALAAPAIAPNDPARQFRDYPFAPPMTVRVRDAHGWHAPFVFPLALTDRLLNRYEVDTSEKLTLTWFSGGRVVGLAGDQPLLLLGSDSLGRDQFSRLLMAARLSLGLAVLATLGAVLVGALVGGIAGYAGGATDALLMRLTELVLVLPLIYVVLAVRTVLPLVLNPAAVFGFMVAVLALAGWPQVARGVRGIVLGERHREYAQAALAAGAGPARLLGRHLLPACQGFLATQAVLLLPAFIVAEATLSYVGLGFAEPTPSWGTMLREAANIRSVAGAPWLLAPAAAIVLVVLALNLVASRGEAHRAGSTAMRSNRELRPGGDPFRRHPRRLPARRGSYSAALR